MDIKAAIQTSEDFKNNIKYISALTHFLTTSGCCLLTTGRAIIVGQKRWPVRGEAQNCSSFASFASEGEDANEWTHLKFWDFEPLGYN